MLNHLLVSVSFINANDTRCTIVGNGRIFWGYKIIQRLPANRKTVLLLQKSVHGKVLAKQIKNNTKFGICYFVGRG